MDENIIHDTITLASNTFSKGTDSGESANWWMWLAIAELGIITILVIKEQIKTKVSAKRQFKSDSLKQDIDFNNIINSSFNSMKLYDELKVKCHPDLFPMDADKNLIAQNIFQEITKNRNNVKRLLELKEEAIQKLKINV